MAGKSVSKRRRILLVISLVLLAAIGYIGFTIVSLVTAKPTISIDYAIEYNEKYRPAGLDPSDNAAPDYKDAFARLPAVPDDARRIVGRLHKYEPGSIEWKAMEAWVASCDDAMPIIHQAARKPDFWIDLPTININDPAAMEEISLSKFHDAPLALRGKAEYLAATGDISGAMDCIDTICRMALHVGRRGRATSLAQMMETIAYMTAFDLLSRADVDSNDLGRFQRQFEEILSQRTPPSFASDEILLRDAIQRYFTDNAHGDGRLIPGALYALRRQVAQSDAPTNELAANALYLKCLWIARGHPTRRQTAKTLEDLIRTAGLLIEQTPWEMHVKGGDHAAPLHGMIEGNDFLQSLSVDRRLSWTIDGFYRIQVSTEALVATMGVLRFHKDKGAWPRSLEEVAAAGYLRRVPMDPYSGKPLAYKPTADSFTLYSCGQDFDDDGGTFSTWGRPPEGGDQVFWPTRER